MYKEKKIASFQQGKDKLQLLELTEIGSDGIETDIKKYQLRLNRKRLQTNYSENQLRKEFLKEVQGIIMQIEIDLTTPEKKYTNIMGGRYYVEEKEVTQKQYWDLCYNNIHNIGTPVKIDYDHTAKRYLIMKEITYEEYIKLK